MTIAGIIASQLGAAGGGGGPSIDAVVAVAQAVTVGATGTLDITTAELGGLTPVAAMIFVSGHDNGNGATPTPDAIMSIGFCTAVAEFVTGTRSQDGPANALTRRETAAACVLIQDDGHSSAYDLVGVFDSFIADGIRIDFTTDDAEHVWNVVVVLFAGTAVQAHVGLVGLGTGTSALDQTAPGFEPEILFGAGSGDDLAAGNSAYFHQMFGCALNDGGVTQKGHSVSMQNLHEEDVEQIIFSANIGGQAQGGGAGTLTYALTISDFDANGFSITPSASTNSDDWFYLALDLGGLSLSLFDISTPTSTGIVSYDTPAFTPQFGMVVTTFNVGRDTVDHDASVHSSAIGVFDGTEQWAVGFKNEWFATGGGNLEDSDSLTYTYAAFAWDPAADTIVITATLDSFDALGFNLNYAAVDGTARMAWGLAIGAG